MHVEYAQLPPPEDSADRIFVTENAVIVLDGATAFGPASVSAQSYAEELGTAIASNLNAEPDINLRYAVGAAISRTAALLDLVGRPTTPSSTVSILRATSTALDILVLGDSPVVWGRGDAWESLCDDRLDQLCLPERDHYRDRLLAGHGFDDEHRSCLRALQEAQARHRNVDGGYWIADVNVTAATKALMTSVPCEDVSWAVVASDGAFDLLTTRPSVSWPEIARHDSHNLAKLLEGMREWEACHDPHGKNFPRSKLHDDKTIAAVIFTSHNETARHQ